MPTRIELEQLEQLQPPPPLEIVAIGSNAYDGIHNTARQLVHGLIEATDVVLMTAPPKTGKSFLGLHLAMAAATGTDWLSFPCAPCRVLVVDMENKVHKLKQRVEAIRTAAGFPSTLDVDLMPLRGKGVSDIAQLAARLQTTIQPGSYSIIVIDPLYKLLGYRNENDNGQMADLLNQLEIVAEQLQAAVVTVHHTSKGNQAAKSDTDYAAGAGSLSRSPDVTINIREATATEDGKPGYFLSFVCRGTKEPDRVPLLWKYPLFSVNSGGPVTSKTPQQLRAENARDTRSQRLEAIQHHYGGQTIASSVIRKDYCRDNSRTMKGLIKAGKQKGILTRVPGPKGRGNNAADIFKVAPLGS